MKEAATFYVYILFRLNGIPCYVGKGKGGRWSRHQGRATNRHLANIIDQARASGRELPKVKAAEGLTEESAFQLERRLIGLIGRGGDGPLVNFTDGGEGVSGYRHSIFQRTKISIALKGKPKAPEHAAAAGAAQRGSKKLTGWWSTEEGRAKQRANNRGHSGRKHSEETKAAIRAARLCQKNVSTAGQFKKRPANEGDFR